MRIENEIRELMNEIKELVILRGAPVEDSIFFETSNLGGLQLGTLFFFELVILRGLQLGTLRSRLVLPVVYYGEGILPSSRARELFLGSNWGRIEFPVNWCTLQV